MGQADYEKPKIKKKKMSKKEKKEKQIEEEETEENPEEEPEEETEEKDEEAEEEEDNEEEETKEGLKSFIKEETVSSLESELDKVADRLVSKFRDGVAKQRVKAINTKKLPKKTSDEQVVRKWFNALLNKDHQTIRSIEKDYLQTGDDTQGGYLIPTPLLAEVNRFVSEYGFARREMRYLPFSGPGNERRIPALDSSVSVYWTDEAEAKTSSKPTFKLVTQTLKKLAAITPLTEEILEDSAINLISLLGELFGEAIAEEEDRVFFAGDTGDGDPYNGVINAANVENVDMGAGDDAADIDADDLNNLIYAVPSAVRRKGKFFLESTLFQTLQQLKTDDGHYIVQQPTGDRPATIWNRPFELIDVLPDSTTGSGNNPIMFYTDLSKTCVYGDKGGIKVKLLDQAVVNSAEDSPSELNLATQDMVAVRIVKRVGYVPVLPSGIAVLRTGA